MPDYAAERQKAEAEALRRRQATGIKGMEETMLGGGSGPAAGAKKKRLLGE